MPEADGVIKRDCGGVLPLWAFSTDFPFIAHVFWERHCPPMQGTTVRTLFNFILKLAFRLKVSGRLFHPSLVLVGPPSPSPWLSSLLSL